MKKPLTMTITLLMNSSICFAQEPSNSPIKSTELTIVVASGSGGGFDLYSRILARHLTKHFPGRAKIIVKNMPGAAGLAATNWAYNLAPRDGTTILSTYSALIDANLLGNKNAKFDIKKFNWLGSIASSPLICITWETSPYKDIKQMIGKPLSAGSTGRTGKSGTTPLLYNEIIGTKFNVITGYPTEGNTLALERGEIDAVCGIGLFTLQASHPSWFDDKKVNVVSHSSLIRIPELDGVTNILDITSNTDRDIVEYGSILEAMGRPYLAPPDVPPDRVKQLRSSFDATMSDREFVQELTKFKLNSNPLTGDEVQSYINKLYDSPSDLVRRVTEVYVGSDN